MNRKLMLLPLLLISVTASAKPLLHLDPEMTGAEYRVLLDKLQKQQGYITKRQDDPLLAILELGKRNLDWIDTINKTRDRNHQLAITTPETTVAYPIDHPGISNRTIIYGKLEAFKNNLPEAMKDVLLGGGPVPATPIVDDETFIVQARIMNHIYEAASRWLLQEPELDEYIRAERTDVRGYYFLQHESDLETKLTNWVTLDSETKGKYTTWLIGECNLAASNYDCASSLSEAIKKNKVNDFHKSYVDYAARKYNLFFEIQNPRPEVKWDHRNQAVMYAPFTQLERQDVADWLKKNVEDEFRLGGDTITMDANRELDEYAVAWTIRHEYGHVLGFPDCYVEFYSQALGVMINYQIDTSNLMCSRRGHLQAQHYAQLRKHYFQG